MGCPTFPAPAFRPFSKPGGSATDRHNLRTELLSSLPDAASPGRDIDPKRPMVLTVSSLIPRKNVMTTLEAATACGRSDLGACGPSRRICLSMTLRFCAISSRAPWSAGERSDVERWLAASDMFVLPSVWESRPLRGPGSDGELRCRSSLPAPEAYPTSWKGRAYSTTSMMLSAMVSNSPTILSDETLAKEAHTSHRKESPNPSPQTAQIWINRYQGDSARNTGSTSIQS